MVIIFFGCRWFFLKDEKELQKGTSSSGANSSGLKNVML
jgi:hypothetical protein